MREKTKFNFFYLPDGQIKYLPADVDLKIPRTKKKNKNAGILAYIPWEKKYLRNVPEEYMDFFRFIFLYLNKRTTNVHVASCLPFIKYLIKAENKIINRRVVYIAFFLHDAGWSKMSDREIGESLSVKGLRITSTAKKSKIKHAVLGVRIAKNVLSKYNFNNPLSEEEKKLVYKIIFFHDRPRDWGKRIPWELKIVSDADHLWSFMRENFWQDTVRKNIDPEIYANNLSKNLRDYLIMDCSRKKAENLLKERVKEIKILKK